VADPQQVEEGRRYRKARKAYEHDRDHGVPDKGHVAPQRRHYVLAIDQSLTLPQEPLQDSGVYLLGDHPAHNLYVKKCVSSATSSHGCHESTEAIRHRR
jgi:hypothetical protein